MRLLIPIILSCVLIISAIASAQVTDYWCRYMNNGPICFNYNTTISSYQLDYLNKVSWNSITDAPAALGGGTTIPITNTTGGNSTQCGGTDKVYNITLKNGLLSIVCDTDLNTGGGGGIANGTNPWLQTISTTNISFNETKANITFLRIPSSKTCTGNDKVNNVTINSLGIFLNCQGDVDTDTTGITSLSQGTNMVFSVNPITTTGTISLGSHTHPFTNMTGTIAIDYTNLTGTVSLGYTNLTGTITLTPPNITGIANSHLHAYTNLTGTASLSYTNLTGTASLGYTNLTGTASLAYTNLTGIASLGYTNLTGTASLRLENISAGTSPAGAFNFANLNATSVLNVTGYVEIDNTATTQLRIVNGTCGGIRNNGTFLIIGGC